MQKYEKTILNYEEVFYGFYYIGFKNCKKEDCTHSRVTVTKLVN